MKTLNPAVKAAFNRVMTRSELEEWCREYTKAQGDKSPSENHKLSHLISGKATFWWDHTFRKFDWWNDIWNRFTKEELNLPIYIEEPKEKEKFTTDNEAFFFHIFN